VKILHFVPHIRNSGNGLVNVALDLACLQAQRGHDVWMLGASGDFVSLLKRYNVHFEPLMEQVGIASKIRNAFMVRRLLKRIRPDVVHAHVVAGVVYAYVSRPGLRYRIIATGHTAFRRSTVLLRLADRVIAVGSENARTLMLRGIPQRKITIARNAPLDSPRRKDLNDAPQSALLRPAVTTICGMYLRKGVDTLIGAFESIASRFPDAQLYLVGAGPDEQTFRNQAAASEFSDRIHFLGFRKDVGQILEASDIFVLASRHDPFPLVIAEARDAGCAVIASRVDGIPEALDYGRAGILVPPDDARLLAAEVMSLLSDGAALEHWQSAARAGLDEYRLPRLIDDTDRIYANA